MGLLVNGKWQDRWYDTKESGGRFVRQASQFREWVSNDGSTAFPAERDRYHLYVSYACPWAHRTLIFRKLKKLEPLIGLSVVDPYMAENGWEFSRREGCIPDSVNGFRYLHQVYAAARPDITTRVTVPVLWDKKEGTIVNNESADIIRMFNRAFDDIGGDPTVDFCPEARREEIDEVSAFIYDHVNNGVYKCGFATAQNVYEEAVAALFEALDELDARLGRHRYLVGNEITEADWRLFTTLIRFDAVYVGHFKCNLRRLQEYANLPHYLRDLYQVPGVAETVRFDHIKEHYYRSHTTINPTQIVPVGPVIDLETDHGRARFAA